MPLLNYTTGKDASETIADIQRILSQYDVSGVMTEFEGRQVSSLSFKMTIGGRPMAFRLPCNWRAVQAALQAYNENRGYRQTSYGRKIRDRIKDDDEHAIKVAWRIIKDWVEAQLALVEVNMTTVPQIFLPYAIMKDDRTLAEHVAEDPSFLLGPGA